MTAEIVVMNKEAVALAADSAVTASISGGEKIFTSADKIFELAKNKPVGMMFFSNSQFLSIPWETIINEINNKIPDMGFPTLEDYADFFISFFKTGKYLFDELSQKRFFGSYIFSYLARLVEDLVEYIDEEIEKRGPINSRRIQFLANKFLKKDLSEWDAINVDAKLVSITSASSEKLVRKYRSTVNDVIKDTFKNIPLSINSRRIINKILINLLVKGMNDDYDTGVVIAGFGEDEIFPSVRAFIVDGMFQGKLKYQKLTDNKVGIDTDGSVMAYAQREMVARFMEGVDPNYREIESGFMSEIADKFGDEILKKLKKYTKSEKQKLSKEISKSCHEIIRQYEEAMDKKIEEEFCDPITDVVSVLPKFDLVKLAESLVSITSLKRRFSPESETVAEPIDVAVISKRDGFVWIKKKRYHDGAYD